MISPGRVSSFPWAFWDIMPTFAELAGAKAPSGLDGISIVPTLKGDNKKQSDHKYLYWTWPGDKSKGKKGYSVRVGNYKGIVFECKAQNLKPNHKDEMQLYNVVNDPFETTDIADKHPAIVAHLKDTVVSEDLTCECYQCR